MALGTTMRFVQTRRGTPIPRRTSSRSHARCGSISTARAYTAQDVITGTLNRESRLTMAPPTVLGRVAINGRDQFITTTGDTARMGVEVRQGSLSVTADSRIVGDPRDIPAVGWAHDFHQVTGTLHVPPGWTVLYATGVDDVPGTWLRHWSLLEIFLALMVGIVIGRLYGLAWGALALVMLVLVLPEADAPKWCWIPLLVLRGARAGPARRKRCGRLLAGASASPPSSSSPSSRFRSRPPGPSGVTPGAAAARPVHRVGERLSPAASRAEALHREASRKAAAVGVANAPAPAGLGRSIDAPTAPAA